MQESSLLAGFYPRYFGYYDRAFTVVEHVSDQLAGFGARAISCSAREAIYVLDGLLENDTVLRPREHYTPIRTAPPSTSSPSATCSGSRSCRG